MFKRLTAVRHEQASSMQLVGEAVERRPGESLAASLLAVGWPQPGRSLAPTNLAQRQTWNYYCGIGVCGECRVMLPNGTSVKACQYEGDNQLPPEAAEP